MGRHALMIHGKRYLSEQSGIQTLKAAYRAINLSKSLVIQGLIH